MKSEKIDKNKLYILWKLHENSRTTYKQLSKVCKLSPVSCYNQVKELKKTGVIKRFTIEIDPKALGYSLEVFMEIKVSRAIRKRIAQEISKIGGVKKVWEITGESDLLVHGFFINNEELDNFITILVKKFPEIKDIITRVVLHAYEDTNTPWFFRIESIQEK